MLCFVGPETAQKRLAVSSNSFAYWLFHAIIFERKDFSENLRIKIYLRETREYRCLLVSTDAEAARVGTDRYTHTDRQTHRQTDRQTHRQTDRQTDTQTDRQTDRQTERQDNYRNPRACTPRVKNTLLLKNHFLNEILQSIGSHYQEFPPLSGVSCLLHHFGFSGTSFKVTQLHTSVYCTPSISVYCNIYSCSMWVA